MSRGCRWTSAMSGSSTAKTSRIPAAAAPGAGGVEVVELEHDHVAGVAALAVEVPARGGPVPGGGDHLDEGVPERHHGVAQPEGARPRVAERGAEPELASGAGWRRRRGRGRRGRPGGDGPRPGVAVRRCARSTPAPATSWRTSTTAWLSLTLNRPERRNAMSRAMLEALGARPGRGRGRRRRGVRRAHRRRRRVLRRRRRQGRWPARRRRRCAFDALRPPPAAQPARDGRRLHRMPKPTIAALPGAGGRRRALARAGVRPALRGRVGVPDHRLRPRRLRRRLRRHLVPHPARRPAQGPRALLLLRAASVRRGVERLGLVNAVFPDDRLEAEVLDRARRLASGPRSPTRT